MIIETKFNPDDEIWVVDIDASSLERIKYNWTVVDIDIAADKHSAYIWYNVDGSLSKFPESDCFATPQEAQDECDKRNKARLG